MPVVMEGFKAADFSKSLGPQLKRFTIETAERALRAEVARGFDPQPVVITDGVPRRDYGDVKPFGKIEFTRRPQMADAVLWALDQLRKRSPVRSGRYVSSHAVLINGEEITGNIAAALRSVKDTDRVQILNPEPYAKKIEGRASSKKRGVTGMRGLSPQAPGGVYRVVARLLVARYGRSMFFDLGYVKISTGVKVRGYAGGGRRGQNGRHLNRRRIVRDHVYPALKFFIKPTGLAN